MGEMAGLQPPQFGGKGGGIEDRADPQPAAGREWRPGRRSGCPGEFGGACSRAKRPEDLLLIAGEGFGPDPIGDDRGDVDSALRLQPTGELDRLDDWHLLARRHQHRARYLRVFEDLSHPPRLVAHRPDLDELTDGGRRTELRDHVTRRRGVDDDQVVVTLAHLPAELADREDLAHAGRRAGDEVERARQRADAGEQRHPQLHR